MTFHLHPSQRVSQGKNSPSPETKKKNLCEINNSVKYKPIQLRCKDFNQFSSPLSPYKRLTLYLSPQAAIHFLVN